MHIHTKVITSEYVRLAELVLEITIVKDTMDAGAVLL